MTKILMNTKSTKMMINMGNMITTHTRTIRMNMRMILKSTTMTSMKMMIMTTNTMIMTTNTMSMRTMMMKKRMMFQSISQNEDRLLVKKKTAMM